MTGGENRRRSILKALRKRRIDRSVSYPFYYRGTHNDGPIDLYKNLHQYSKNKILTDIKALKGPDTPITKISDVRKLQRLEYSKEDLVP